KLVADEAGGGREGLDGGLLLCFRSPDADVNLGLLQIRSHAHFGGRGEVRQARIVQFAREHSADFVADFTGDALVTMSCDGHMAKTKSRFLVAIAPRNDSV